MSPKASHYPLSPLFNFQQLIKKAETLYKVDLYPLQRLKWSVSIGLSQGMNSLIRTLQEGTSRLVIPDENPYLNGLSETYGKTKRRVVL